MKVVLVEDSLEMQHALRKLLAPLRGVEVVGCAEDRHAALQLIDDCDPDLVLLDVALRGCDRGYDVLRQVVRERPHTEVVVLSNFGWGAMREAFLRAGARAYFDKAFEVAGLRDWLAARADQRVGAVACSQRATIAASATG